MQVERYNQVRLDDVLKAQHVWGYHSLAIVSSFRGREGCPMAISGR